MLKVSSPAELLSAVPFLVGFHPDDSLIVVAMRGTRITFVARADLPGHTTPEEEARAAVLHLATVVVEQEAEAVAIIGYGEESRVTPAVVRVSDAFRKANLTIVDELRVADGRYWSYLCQDTSCCPPEGQPCEPAYSVVATEATYAGAVALPSREALAGQLAPVTGDDREAMTAATARAILRLAALAAERRPEPEVPTDEAPAAENPAAEAPADETPADETPADEAPHCETPGGETPGDPQGSAAGREHQSVTTGRQGGNPQARSGTQLWMADEVNILPRRPVPQSADAAEPIADDAREAPRFHDREAPRLLAAASAASRPGPPELRLSNVIWASLGLAPPAPDELSQLKTPHPEGPDLEPEPAESDLESELESEPAESDLESELESEPAGSGSATKRSDLLSDEDYFFALVRSAGRTAIQEAERCYSTGGRLTDDDAAWLGVLLLNMPVRDYVWTRTRTHEWELALWSDLVRRVEPRYVPAPASLLAFVAWRRGNGPLASVAVARALDQKLDYQMAHLIQGALVIGLSPSVLDGWPVVEGMPLLSECLDSEDDPRRSVATPEASNSLEPTDRHRDRDRSSAEAESGLNRPGRQGHLPVRVRSDAIPADARTGAGDGPGRRDKRPHKTRRASRRRL